MTKNSTLPADYHLGIVTPHLLAIRTFLTTK